jgi:hypothetical protein
MARARMLIATLSLLVLTGDAEAQRAAVPTAKPVAVPLATVLTAAAAYPNLRQEIKLALIRAGLSRDAATCSAARLGDEWSKLAGRTLAPYRCVLGARTVLVTSTPVFFDAARHKLAPDDPRRPARAVTFTEQRLAWRWQ